MVMYKLRTGAYQTNGSPIKVLTIPSSIAIFHEKTSFTIEQSGTSIIFTSGTKQNLTTQQLESYKFEDCKL